MANTDTDTTAVYFPNGSTVLTVADPREFAGTIFGFVPGETIDLSGIGTATSATLNSKNVLTISGAGKQIALQLDPNEVFAGSHFVVTPDGNGGTDVSLVPDVQGGSSGFLYGNFNNFFIAPTLEESGSESTPLSPSSLPFTYSAGGKGLGVAVSITPNEIIGAIGIVQTIQIYNPITYYPGYDSMDMDLIFSNVVGTLEIPTIYSSSSGNSPTEDSTASASLKITVNGAGAPDQTHYVFTAPTTVSIAIDATASINGPAGAFVDFTITDTLHQPGTTPPAVTGLALAPASDSGVRGDEITNVVEPKIIGFGEAGDTVDLYDGDTLVGTGKVDTAGNWAITVNTPLTDGPHTLTATETLDGETSSPSAALVITIDTTPPDPPSAPLLGSTAPGGTNGGTEITDLSRPLITGTAAPGDAIDLYAGSTLLGEGTADADGQWSITARSLTPGSYDLTATATDAVGNVSVASPITNLTVIPDTQTAVAVGAGNADVVLGAGNFAITFGDGDVSVQAARGMTSITGGGGNDGLDIGAGDDAVMLGNGNDAVIGTSGNDVIQLGNGQDLVTLSGGRDSVTVGSGTDTVSVGNGNDQITANGGNDTFIVGNGHDTVSGGAGNDVFDLAKGHYSISGTGADTLVLSSPSGVTTMAVFNPAQDQIGFTTGFDLGVDNGQATGAPQPIDPSLLSPSSGGQFTTAGERFAYNVASGQLYYSADGNGGDKPALIATLENHPVITVSDLYFIS